MKELKLSAPWVEYVKKIQALFGADPDIHLEIDDEDNILRLFVDGQEKADALTQLLPSQVDFGNVRLYVSVIPANKEEETTATLFKKAFDGNPIVSYMASADINGGTVSYLVFRNRVVQYFRDDMQDPHGNRSTLYHDLANEIFDEHEGVFFAVDAPKNLGGIK